MKKVPVLIIIVLLLVISSAAFIFPASTQATTMYAGTPKALLIQTKRFLLNSFVNYNMAEAWVDDTFRICPGKYGEDPLWEMPAI